MDDGTRILPLSVAQRRIWSLEEQSGGAFYRLPLAIPFLAPVNTTALRRGLQALVEQREALRTVFETRDGEPVRKILPNLAASLSVVDLAGMARDKQHAEAMRLAAEMAQGFDLARGPLWRLALLREQVDQNMILIIMHHIISDGWSVDILLRELGNLYNRHLPPSEPPVAYADFLFWRLEHLEAR